MGSNAAVYQNWPELTSSLPVNHPGYLRHLIQMEGQGSMNKSAINMVADIMKSSQDQGLKLLLNEEDLLMSNGKRNQPAKSQGNISSSHHYTALSKQHFKSPESQLQQLQNLAHLALNQSNPMR